MSSVLCWSLRNPLALIPGLWLMNQLAAAAEPRCLEPDAATGSSSVVVVEGVPLVHTAQVFPPASAGTPGEQVRLVLQRLDETLERAGSSLQQAVKLNVYVTQSAMTATMETRLSTTYGGAWKPAVSYVTTPLPDPEHLVAVDAVAMRTNAVARTVVRSPGSAKGQPAESAVLPPGPRVYISGQAEAGDGTLADATRKTMQSLFATLKWLELTPDDVVEVKAFLTPMKEAQTAIMEMSRAFGDAVPAPISVVEWISGTPIEIELVAAARPRAQAPPSEYLTPPGMTVSPVFARVVRADSPASIYFSSLYGQTDKPDSEEEQRELFTRTERLARLAGSDLKHLVKATYYVTNNEVNGLHNRLRPMYYDPQRPPAASKAMVHGTGRAGRTITWDIIAVPR